VIGGRGESSRVLIYDRTTGWTRGAAMPQKRDHLGAVVVGTKIYALGGRDSRILDRVDVYDIAADSWTEGPALPRATSGMAAELLSDGRIHVVGGEDPGTIGGTVIDRHYVFDPATGTWSRGPTALLAVHGAGVDEVAGLLVVAGGARRQGALSVLAWTGVTQRFNPAEAPATRTPAPTPSPSPTASTPAPVGSLPGD
jgi:N-acetylneuraminic acid mutarotase